MMHVSMVRPWVFTPRHSWSPVYVPWETAHDDIQERTKL